MGTLWALAYLAVNGGLPSLLLFGGMAILALDGMPAIDAKRVAHLGEA
ncbi:NnrU family protein [Pelomicrobium sp.]